MNVAIDLTITLFDSSSEVPNIIGNPARQTSKENNKLYPYP